MSHFSWLDAWCLGLTAELACGRVKLSIQEVLPLLLQSSKSYICLHRKKLKTSAVYLYVKCALSVRKCPNNAWLIKVSHMLVTQH